MKIAIIRLSSLGDIVHTSIVLQFIKKNIKDSEIHWICDGKFCEILTGHEYIDRLISLNLKDKKIIQSYKILKEVRKENYDFVIDFQGLLKSAIVGRILSRNLIGFDENSIRESIAAKFYNKKFFVDYRENIILRNLKLASLSLGFSFEKDEIDNKKPCFDTLKRDKPINSIKKILITIGSSWKSKIYPTNLQIDLINRLKDYDVYLSFGNEFEKQIAKEISSATHAKILERTKIKELVVKMNEFDLVVGPDSGVTHIAWAQNIPSITLYGPTPSFRNSYVTKNNLVLDSGKKIDPLKLNKYDDCIKLIKPDCIYQKIKEELEEGNGR